MFSLGLLAQAFHVPLFVALLWRQSCEVAGIPSFKQLVQEICRSEQSWSGGSCLPALEPAAAGVEKR